MPSYIVLNAANTEKRAEIAKGKVTLTGLTDLDIPCFDRLSESDIKDEDCAGKTPKEIQLIKMLLSGTQSHEESREFHTYRHFTYDHSTGYTAYKARHLDPHITLPQRIDKNYRKIITITITREMGSADCDYFIRQWQYTGEISLVNGMVSSRNITSFFEEHAMEEYRRDDSLMSRSVETKVAVFILPDKTRLRYPDIIKGIADKSVICCTTRIQRAAHGALGAITYLEIQPEQLSEHPERFRPHSKYIKSQAEKHPELYPKCAALLQSSPFFSEEEEIAPPPASEVVPAADSEPGGHVATPSTEIDLDQSTEIDSTDTGLYDCDGKTPLISPSTGEHAATPSPEIDFYDYDYNERTPLISPSTSYSGVASSATRSLLSCFGKR